MPKQTDQRIGGILASDDPFLIFHEEGDNPRPPRILLAFEDPDIIHQLERSLRQAGCKIMIAGDGGEALNRVRSEMPDLVVMDTLLPPVDGFDVVKGMKANPDTGVIPIILIETKRQLEDAIVFRYWQSGADCLRTVPLDPTEITTLIQSIFGSIAPRTHEEPSREPPPNWIEALVPPYPCRRDTK